MTPESVEELVVRGPVAFYQRGADEQFPGQRRVDPAEVHLALGDERDAVKGDPLVPDDGGLLLFPVRLVHAALDEVRADLLHPFRLDLRDATRIQPLGVDQLGRHQPLAGLLGQEGARMRPELDAARAEVGADVGALRLFRLEPDVAQQAGQQRLVDGIEVRAIPAPLCVTPARAGIQFVYWCNQSKL